MAERFQGNLVEKNPRASMLSKAELLQRAQRDFGPRFAQDTLQKFVSERVTGFHLNGIDVVLIDFDHEQQSIHPLTRAYISSPRTKLIVPEYFEPDLERHKVFSSEITKTI